VKKRRPKREGVGKREKERERERGTVPVVKRIVGVLSSQKWG